MARGLAGVLSPAELTIVVNVGDDDFMHGVHVAADLDTVTYTLAGRQGPHGWGLADDTHVAMEALEALGGDATFRIGDRDLATSLMRTDALRRGEPLSSITARITRALGVEHRILPASDDPVRTRVRTVAGEWLDFQEYFVLRRHADEIDRVRYDGSGDARPGPGVLEAIATADLVVIAPSNPPLSIHPILAIPAIGDAMRARTRRVAISPLFGGRALKGPADRVMASLGLPPGTPGVLATYAGLIDELVVDLVDADDAGAPGEGEVVVRAAQTRITDPEAGYRLATWLLDTACR